MSQVPMNTEDLRRFIAEVTEERDRLSFKKVELSEELDKHYARNTAHREKDIEKVVLALAVRNEMWAAAVPNAVFQAELKKGRKEVWKFAGGVVGVVALVSIIGVAVPMISSWRAADAAQAAATRAADDAAKSAPVALQATATANQAVAQSLDALAKAYKASKDADAAVVRFNEGLPALLVEAEKRAKLITDADVKRAQEITEAFNSRVVSSDASMGYLQIDDLVIQWGEVKPTLITNDALVYGGSITFKPVFESAPSLSLSVTANSQGQTFNVYQRTLTNAGCDFKVIKPYGDPKPTKPTNVLVTYIAIGKAMTTTAPSAQTAPTK